jgi:hypothetical protein
MLSLDQEERDYLLGIIEVMGQHRKINLTQKLFLKGIGLKITVIDERIIFEWQAFSYDRSPVNSNPFSASN